MPDFNTWSGLLKHLDKTVEKSMWKIGEEIKEVLKFNVQQHWYNNYTPSAYDRTFQVLDSIKVKNVNKILNGYQVEIGFDYDMIAPASSINGNWDNHMSLDGSTSYEGKSIGELLVGWMDKGQHSSVFSYTGVNFIEDTREWSKEEVVHLLKEQLEKAGFMDVKIGRFSALYTRG